MSFGYHQQAHYDRRYSFNGDNNFASGGDYTHYPSPREQELLNRVRRLTDENEYHSWVRDKATHKSEKIGEQLDDARERLRIEMQAKRAYRGSRTPSPTLRRRAPPATTRHGISSNRDGARINYGSATSDNLPPDRQPPYWEASGGGYSRAKTAYPPDIYHRSFTLSPETSHRRSESFHDTIPPPLTQYRTGASASGSGGARRRSHSFSTQESDGFQRGSASFARSATDPDTFRSDRENISRLRLSGSRSAKTTPRGSQEPLDTHIASRCGTLQKLPAELLDRVSDLAKLATGLHIDDRTNAINGLDEITRSYRGLGKTTTDSFKAIERQAEETKFMAPERTWNAKVGGLFDDFLGSYGYTKKGEGKMKWLWEPAA